MSSGMVARSAWNDRFRKPSAELLIDQITKSLKPAADSIRELLLASDGASEEVSWQGVPWRWSVLFRHEAVAGRAWVYLVPQPNQPLVVIPLTAEGIAALPMRKLLKPVRDAITHAKQVDGIRWAQWDIQSKSQVETLMKLARIQLETVSSGVTVASA
ncbi:MAG: hypothetical protein KF805_02660 [Phycisphaeraceae bacterium]|nr:hypothetical protein [Phycisphaeraceae bacterium]